jgi:hypothetical protein
MDLKEGDFVRFKHKRVETTGTVIKRSGTRIRVQPKDGGATLWKELSELLPLASPVLEVSEALGPVRPDACDDEDDTNLDDIDDGDDAVAVAAQSAQAVEAEAAGERLTGMVRIRGGMGAGASALTVESPDADIKAAYKGASAQERSVFLVHVGEQEKRKLVSLGLDVPEAAPSERLMPEAEAKLAASLSGEKYKQMEVGAPPEEIVRVLSGLDDRLADALLAGDIKLLRVSWLRRLRGLLRQPDWRLLKRRQELEALRAESPFLSAEEAVALLRRGTRGVGALTHGWLSPGECDPDGARLDMVLAALDEHLHIEGVFWDYASLFQNLPDRERTPDERAAFERAIMVMADVYASAVGTTVLQSREIPPRPKAFDGALCLFGLKLTTDEAALRETLGGFGTIDAFELKRNPPVVRFASHEAALAAKRAGPWPELWDAVDTLYNERPYDERGWCVFENAVSYELLARLGAVPRVREALDALPPKVLVLRSGQPTEPGVAPAGQLETRVADVVSSIERATFTGKGDKATVPALYRKYVARIVGVVQSVLVLASGSATAAPAEPLPQVDAPAAAPLRLAEGQPLLRLSWQGNGAGGGPRFGVVDATGGRVVAAVTGGDNAELAYDRYSQAVLPWRPPAAGWDAAVVGDARALRDLAEPSRRLADDARRMESESALRAVGKRAREIADGAARCQTIAHAAHEAGGAVLSCVDAAAALFKTQEQGDPTQLQAALGMVRAAVERLQPVALEAALTAALRSSGASGARRYAAGQPLTVRTAGGWRDADVATAGAEGLYHQLTFLGGSSGEPPATLTLHPWNHAPRELPYAAFEALSGWWTRELRKQHTQIFDVLTGKQLDALKQCVAIEVMGYADLAGVRDVRGLSDWLHSLHAARSLGEAITAPGAALLTAPPAAGKTTLISQAVVLALDRAELVPIVIKVQLLQARLRDAPDAFASHWNWVDAYLCLTERPEVHRMLRQAMMARRALLLLDGLDEAGAKRAEIEQHIVEVLAPQGHVMLCTSRPAGVDEARFAGFRLLKLAPLTEAQQKQALLQRLGNEGDVRQLMAFVERMPTSTDPDAPTTQHRVTANPLMLSMVASVFEIRKGLGMPETVAELYASASDAMLARGGGVTAEVRTLLEAVFFEAHVAQARVITDVQLLRAALGAFAPAGTLADMDVNVVYPSQTFKGRLEVGHYVELLDGERKGQCGEIVEIDGSSNSYKVELADGATTGWLQPKQLGAASNRFGFGARPAATSFETAPAASPFRALSPFCSAPLSRSAIDTGDAAAEKAAAADRAAPEAAAERAALPKALAERESPLVSRDLPNEEALAQALALSTLKPSRQARELPSVSDLPEATLTILLKVLSNVIENPDEPRFRLLKSKTNKALSQKLFPHQDAVAFLCACGFEESNEGVHLPDGADLKLVDEALNSVRTALEPAGKSTTTPPPPPAAKSPTTPRPPHPGTQYSKLKPRTTIMPSTSSSLPRPLLPKSESKPPEQPANYDLVKVPPKVYVLMDVNEAVRPAAASPRKSPAEEVADALQLGAYAAEDQKNERWKDARRGFFAAHGAEFYGGDQVLVHAPNDKQVAARSEASAFTGEGHSIAGPRDEGVVVVPPAIHPLAAAAPSRAGAAPPPTPAAAKTKPSKAGKLKRFDVPENESCYIPPPLPPTRFQVGERVQCNMGLKDGTTSWFAGIVEAIDVSKSLDGSVPKQYKYQVKLDDRTIGCAFAPEDTEYCIRAEGGTPASPEKPALPGSPIPPPTPPSAFGSFRFGVGDSVACLLRADDHRTPAWFPGVVTHVDGWTQGRYYVYLVQLDDGVIAYVPEDSDAICVSKTPKVVVTALGTFSTTHENAVARDALELVQKLLLNVIKNPDEPKYRIVKLANQKLQTKLFCLSGGIELMQSLGFEKHANEELELPRFKPIATLTRCHVAVQDALDLLARRAVATTPAPADSAPEQPMVPTRQSTITTEMESLWKAQESANVPMLPKRAKSVRSQLIEDLIEELKPIIYSGSSQSERLAIYCAAKAEIERLESLPAGYSAADLLHQRVDAPSPAQSNVFGTPDAMAVVRKLQVPYNWRKGMTLAFEYEGEEIELVAPEGTQPGDMVMLTLPRRAEPRAGGAPPSPIISPEAPQPNPESPFNQVQDDGRSLARALVDRILNQISKVSYGPVYPDETLLPQRSMSKVVSIAAAAVQKELAEAPATDSVWVGDLPVSWSTFLLPADAAARHLFPLANLSSETNIVDPLSGRSCLAWQPPFTFAGTVEPELLRASELHPLATLGDGNCLLHAAALGAWGVHDQAGTKNVGALRAMVFNLLNNEQFVKVLLPRMRAEQVSVMIDAASQPRNPPHNPDAHPTH